MSGTRSLSSKRLSFSQKSQSNLYKPKCTTNINQSTKNFNSTSIKTKPLKKSSSSMTINPNSKMKPDKNLDQKKTINNNTQNEQISVDCDLHATENNDNAVQQIKLSFPPGITVDQDGKAPVNSTLVKQKYRKMLTSYEMTEIDDYSDIYYIGNSTIMKNSKGSFDHSQTFQYQAKSGDHIAYRYEILSVLHVGPYSTIYKCTDHKSKEKVAIKILINTPEIHQKRHVEVENMKILSSNDAPTDMTPIEQIQAQSKSSDDNIKHYVKMIDSFIFRNHICIVMELLGESLEKFMAQNPIKMQKKGQQQTGPFSPLMVKLIAYQIMDGLADIHRKKIIHRDLKPQNILFSNPQQEKPPKPKPKTDKNPNQQNMTPHITSAFTESDNLLSMSKVKIIDFGSSYKQSEILSNHIKNRFYAAPELVLGSSYGTSIDVWSAGCIIVELFIGKPLFPAINDIDLLAKFIEILGQPPQNIVEMKSDFQSKSGQQKTSKKFQPVRNKFFGKDGSLLNIENQPVPFKNRLTTILKSSDTMMIDFLSKCLEWDKSKRLSAAKLCKHPWIAGLAKQNI